MQKTSLVRFGLSLGALLLAVGMAKAEGEQPAPTIEDQISPVDKLARAAMKLEDRKDLGTPKGVAAVENNFDALKHFCVDLDDATACAAMFPAQRAHPARSKELLKKLVQILKTKCQSNGYAGDGAAFCKLYGYAVTDTGDIKSAKDIFKRHCDAGGASSCQHLADLLYEKDKRESSAFAVKACRLNSHLCARTLSSMPDLPDIKLFEAETDKTCVSATLGSAAALACNETGEHWFKQGNYEQALIAFSKECEAEHSWSCIMKSAILAKQKQRDGAKAALLAACPMRYEYLRGSNLELLEQVCPKLKDGKDLKESDWERLDRTPASRGW